MLAVFLAACSSENPNIEPEEVRIAVIDTGFSPKAIPAENIIPGHNYLYFPRKILTVTERQSLQLFWNMRRRAFWCLL